MDNSVANLKRLKSLNEKINGYHQQKSLIKLALSKIDFKAKNKIRFDETNHNDANYTKKSNDKSKSVLFENDSDNDEFSPNFEVKEQFEGKRGQKLVKLQSKYKHDKRFSLDERFLEENNANEISDNKQDNITIEDEAKKQYEILEEVLGEKVLLPKSQNKSQQKGMLRFDPTQPEHAKYEVKTDKTLSGVKKKKREKIEKLQIEQHEVSKEVFYKVSDNLKEAFQENGFSLLSTFGKVEENELEETENIEEVKKLKYAPLNGKTNPFKFDSSDDEDIEEKDIPEKFEPKQSDEPKCWFEPFFFKTDDYRLQEGHDFMKKMKSEVDESEEFGKVRQDLKKIVRAKVRNNLRNNKPFKKKLGGNRRKKLIRIKKAVQR